MGRYLDLVRDIPLDGPATASQPAAHGSGVEKGAADLPTKPFDWLTRWRLLAALAGHVSKDAPIFIPVMEALEKADAVVRSPDLGNFEDEFNQAHDRILWLTGLVPGKMIFWRGFDRNLHGPASITELTWDEGRLWICVRWQGQVCWLNEGVADFEASKDRPTMAQERRTR